MVSLLLPFRISGKVRAMQKERSIVYYYKIYHLHPSKRQPLRTSFRGDAVLQTQVNSLVDLLEEIKIPPIND